MKYALPPLQSIEFLVLCLLSLKSVCISMFNMPGGVKLLMEDVSFQAYIEIFNKIEEVNIAALVVSSITIIVLAINNEFLKVSA